MRKENLIKTTCKYKLNIWNESFNISMLILQIFFTQDQSDTLIYFDYDRTFKNVLKLFKPI